MIALCRPHVTDEDIEAVAEVLRSGQWAAGPRVALFETAFAQAVGVKHACAVNSCASALQLALEGLARKGEVILPSFTFAASANAVVRAGCTPVFADVELTSGNLAPHALAACLTPDTVAVMAVHYAGLPCDLDPVMDFCRTHRLTLIEDCAEAAGARYHGRAVGSFGAGCFSFFPTKNLSTGEGGMLTTDDPALDARARRLRGHGVVRRNAHLDWQRDVEEAGFNFRLTEIQAALGISQLKRLEVMNARRRALAAIYRQRLSNLDGIELPPQPSDRTHVYQMFVVRVVHPRLERNALVHHLRAQGVEASVHFDPPLHRTKGYADVRAPGGLVNTDTLSATVLTLPMSAVHTDEEILTVCDVLRDGVTRALNAAASAHA